MLHNASTTLCATLLARNVLKRYINSASPSLTAADTSSLPNAKVSVFNQAITQIRHGLKSNKPELVQKQWSILEQNLFLQLLGRAQLDSFSKLIAGHYGGQDPNNNGWEIMETIALKAAASAAGGATEGLVAYMLFEIKKQEPEKVLEVYDKYLALVEDKDFPEDPLELEQESRQEPYDGLFLPNQFSDSSSPSPGRVQILLAAITAHAQKESFVEALGLYLKTPTRLLHYTVKYFVKLLGNKPELACRVTEYAQALDMARLVSRPVTFSRQITNLGRDHSIAALQKLYNATINGLTGPNAFLSAHSSTLSPSQPILMPESGWTAFLTAFLRCRRKDLAEKLWEDMIGLGITPGVSVWTGLFDGYSKNHAPKEVLSAWNSMLQQGVAPNGMAYRALLSALFNAHEPFTAMEVFKAFNDDKLKGQMEADDAVTLSVHNTVLHGLLINTQEKEATELLRQMETKGPVPDLVSYNTFMRYHARRGDFKSLSAVFRDLSTKGLVGDVFTFSTLLSALLKIGREDATEMMMALMKKQGIQPNVASFSAVIDFLMREKDEKSLKAALDLLQQMENSLDKATQPNEVTYTTILAGLYREPWLAPSKADECREEIFRRMRKRDIRPNRVMYHILIKACLENPRPEGLRDALNYYQEMTQRSITLGHDTWYILLHGMADREEWEIANRLIGDMYKAGHEPIGGVLEMIQRIRRRRLRR